MSKMPQILYDDSMRLVVLSCEYFHGLTQAEVQEWTARAGVRTLSWLNIYCKANLVWAMRLVEHSARKQRMLCEYLHTALHSGR